MTLLPQEAECKRILKHYGENFEAISVMLDRQFQTIHSRAQVLLGICGVLITSISLLGQLQSDVTAMTRVFRILSGFFALLSAIIIILKVISVQWMTQQPGNDIQDWIKANLAWRDQKTNFYRVSTLLLLFCIGFYQLALVFMLIHVIHRA
jgi:hypothetical protein